MFYTLYQITNKLNGKHYIGKTCQGFKRRWSRHRWESARNGKCRIHQAIKKYGVENFDAKPILIGPNVEWINEMEMRTIKLYDSFCQSSVCRITYGKKPRFTKSIGRQSRKSKNDEADIVHKWESFHLHTYLLAQDQNHRRPPGRSPPRLII